MNWQANKLQQKLIKLDKDADEREASAVYSPEKHCDNYNHPVRKWYES